MRICAEDRRADAVDDRDETTVLVVAGGAGMTKTGDETGGDDKSIVSSNTKAPNSTSI
jgi:hypothetical protein